MRYAFLALSLILAAPAFAADHLRISKPEVRAFDFTPIEIGSENGIFAKYGIETESIGFGGVGRRHQPPRQAAGYANALHGRISAVSQLAVSLAAQRT